MKKASLLSVVLVMLLSACDHPPAESTSAKTVALGEKTELDYELDALRLMPFLAVHDDAIAAAWLSLQDNKAQSDYIPSAANIAQYESRIQFLAKKLKEDRRIIANRTVQTRDLLEQAQIEPQTLIQLLDSMTEVANAGVEGDYGSYCQWYVNLRESKHSHRDAIEKMKELK